MTHPWLGILLGTGLIAAGWLELDHTLLLLRSGVRTVGYVKGFREETRDDGKMYYPIIHFTDQDGRERTAPATVGSNSKGQMIGDLVTVIYVPEDPESARVDEGLALWMVPIVSIPMGILICVFSVLELLK
jgi:hypothetical protein